MITNESVMNKMALVSRLFSHQHDQGVPTESALANMRDTLPAQYQNSIDALEKMISGREDVVLTGYGVGPYEIFSRFVKIIRQEGGEVTKIFTSSQSVLRDSVIQAQEYWSGYNSLLAYLGFIVTIAAICISIYTIFVLPQFSEMFNAFGAQLPPLTQMVLNRGIVFELILIFMVLVVIVSIISSYHIKKRVGQFLPLHNWLIYVPGLSKLSSIYSYFLFIQYTNVLIKAGLSSESAMQHARNICPLKEKRNNIYRTWLDAINASSVLGSLEQEIEFQVNQVDAFFNRQMVVVRDRMALSLQVALGLIVGVLVIAMYLPIFKLGAVI